jgi:uncharacterized protein
MTLLTPQRDLMWGPPRSVLNEPFWSAAARGELHYQECRTCMSAIHAPASICGRCWGTNLVWRRSGGRGTVYSWTVVWRAPGPEFTVPYAPIIVLLDEGWSLLSCLIECDHTEVRSGLRVEVKFSESHHPTRLPYFVLSSG